MSESDRLSQILSKITPDRLRSIVGQLVSQRPAARREGLSLHDIIAAFAAGAEWGSGREEWRAQLRIKAAIIETLSQMPDLGYAEGDA